MMAGTGILTDEQIDALLNEAEARLRAKDAAPTDDEISLDIIDKSSRSRKP
jgi:hypothetical protein